MIEKQTSKRAATISTKQYENKTTTTKNNKSRGVVEKKE